MASTLRLTPTLTPTPTPTLTLALTLTLTPTTQPGAFYSTDRSTGYNCSRPLRGVVRERTPTATSLMGQTTRRASPRITCPTDDDADGLRYLYPECDQLTQCETIVNSTGCQTYVGGYNYDEAYQIEYEDEDGDEEDFFGRRLQGTHRGATAAHGAARQSVEGRRMAEATEATSTNDTVANATEDVYSSRPGEWNRPLAPMRCVTALAGGSAVPVRNHPRAWLSVNRVRPVGRCTSFGEYEGTAVFRAGLLAVQIMLLQVIIILSGKYTSKFLLLLPCLKETRKRNMKLQGMASLRKAEIRRMGEKGQNFVVKQEAKKVDGLNADDAIAMLAKVTSGEVESPGPAKKGLKDVSKSMARSAPVSATSLLMKGVETAALEREKAAQLKIAKANEAAEAAVVAAEDAAAPAGVTPGAERPKKLSFGEYMNRSGGKPEGKPEAPSSCETTMARVRGTAGPTGSGIKPVPARLPSSPNFANDMKQLTAATASAAPQRPQLGSPGSLRRSASSSKVQPTPSPGREGRPFSEADVST